jgi:hypothetical protein
MSDKPSNDDHLIAEMPSPQIVQMMGLVNIAWAQADVLASSALLDALPMDPIEFAHLVGPMDIRLKIAKLCGILLHRRDPRHAAAKTILKQIDDGKEFRNAITHGFYVGRLESGEHFYQLFGHPLTDEEQPSAHKLFYFTSATLTEHVATTTRITNDLMALVSEPTRRLLLSPPARVPSKRQGGQAPGKRHK